MSAINTPAWLKKTLDGGASFRSQASASPPSLRPRRALQLDLGVVLTGAHEETLDGEYWIDLQQPEVNGRVHLVGSGGGHIYFLPADADQPARWVLNDRFVPHKTLDSACVATVEAGSSLPSGPTNWNYHAVVLGMAKVKGRKRELNITSVADAIALLPETSPPASPVSPKATRSGSSPKPPRTGSAGSPNTCRLQRATMPGITEMTDMVSYLRVDPEEPEEMMRILAEEMLLCPTPEPWCEFYDGMYGGMFFHNRLTKATSWHHPLESHFVATCERLKALRALAKQLRESGNEVEATQMEGRSERVHTLHTIKLRGVLAAETEQAREIRRMRYTRTFRQHANNKADEEKGRQRLLLEKVAKILGSGSKEFSKKNMSAEEADAAAGPKKKTHAMWAKAVRAVKVTVISSTKEEPAASDDFAEKVQVGDNAKEPAASDAVREPATALPRSKSQPHDFNTTQLAQWRILTQYKTSSVGESAVRAEAEKLIGQPPASRMTQGRILLALRQENDWERPPAATRIQAIARGWLTRKHNHERMLARLAEMEGFVSTMLARIRNARMYAVWCGWRERINAKRRRELAMQMMLRLKHSMLLNVLAGFKQRVSAAKENRCKEELAKQMVTRMLNVLVCKAWASWRRFVEAATRKQSAELMAKRLQNALLYKCFMAFAYTSAIAQKERQKEELARTFVKKMTNALANLCYNHWLDHLYSSRRARAATQMLLRMRNKQLFMCLEAFKERVGYAIEKREKEELARSLTLKWRSGPTGQAWARWEDYTAIQRRKALAYQMVLRLQNQAVYKCWLGWMHYLEFAHKKRRAVRMMMRLAHRCAWQCLIAWQELVEAKRIMKQHEKKADKMMRRLMNQQLYEAFSQWQFWAADTVDKRAKARRMVKKMLHQTANAALLQWHFWVIDTQEKRAKSDTMVRRMLNKQLHRAFQRWVETTDETVAIKHKANRALLRMKNRKLSAAYMAWSDWVAGTIHKRALAAGMVGKMLNRQLYAAYSQWRFWAHDTREKQSKATNMVRRMLNRKLDTAYQQWHFWAVDTIDKREMATTMAKRLMNKALYEGFNQWHVWASDTRHHRQLAAVVLGRLLNNSLAAAFNGWRAFLHEIEANRERVHGYLMVMLNRRAHKVVVQWKCWMDDTKRLRGLASTMLSRLRNRQLSRALLQWRETIEMEKKEFLAHQMLNRLLHKTLFVAWNQWFEYHEYCRKESAATKMARRLLNKALFEAFNAWAAFAIFEKQKKAGRHMLKRMMNKLLFSAFSAWIHWHALERQNKLSRKMLVRVQAKALYIAYTSWQDFVASEQQTRRKEAAARAMLKRLRNNQVFSAMQAWVDFAEWEQKKRRAVQMLRQLQSSQLRECLSGFRTNVQAQLNKRRGEESASNMARRMLNRQNFEVFINWHRFTLFERQAKLAMQMLYRLKNQAVYSVLGEWKDYVIICRDKQVKERKVVTMLARSQRKTLHSCFSTWIAWHREAVWLRFEEHAWQTERQIRAAQRAEQRNLREQAKRSIREEIMDVNTSLINLSSMLVDEFGATQGPSRALQKYKLENENVAVPLVEPLPPFVPAGPSKVRLNAKETDINKPRRQRRTNVNGPGNTDPTLGKRDGQHSPEGSSTTTSNTTKAATTSTLHALTGSPPKRGGPRLAPAPLAPIPGVGGGAKTQHSADADDWWKTRARMYVSAAGCIKF